jgi:hypothetical protein
MKRIGNLKIFKGSRYIIRVMKQRREFSTNGEKKNAYKILVEEPEGKRPVGRP